MRPQRASGAQRDPRWRNIHLQSLQHVYQHLPHLLLNISHGHNFMDTFPQNKTECNKMDRRAYMLIFILAISTLFLPVYNSINLRLHSVVTTTLFFSLSCNQLWRSLLVKLENAGFWYFLVLLLLSAPPWYQCKVSKPQK